MSYLYHTCCAEVSAFAAMVLSSTARDSGSAVASTPGLPTTASIVATPPFTASTYSICNEIVTVAM